MDVLTHTLNSGLDNMSPAFLHGVNFNNSMDK